MNERIQLLAEQAGYTPLPGFDFANNLQEVFLNKFAELIVRECMNQCVSDDDEDWDRGVAWAYRQIQEHFGVEE